MKLAPVVLAAALLVTASGARAAARVELSFLPPTQYTDVGDSLWQKEDNLKQLGAYVTKLGEKTLAVGQVLKISFLDIDLAGRPPFMHRTASDLRIMTGGADWPRMRLHWELQTPGQPDRGGDAELSDMNYMFGVRPIGADAPMYYDKRMFDQWFAKTFRPAAP